MSLEIVLLLLVAVLWSSLLGSLIGQILIQKINPESFHWTMETHMAYGQWAGVCLILLVVGVGVSMGVARQGLDPKRLAQSLRAEG